MILRCSRQCRSTPAAGRMRPSEASRAEASRAPAFDVLIMRLGTAARLSSYVARGLPSQPDVATLGGDSAATRRRLGGEESQSAPRSRIFGHIGRRLGDRSLHAGGKSGLLRAGWWVTPTVRKDRESATEKRPPASSIARSSVRVKRRGKSSPRGRRRPRHGKPHPEKGHVGGSARPVHGPRVDRSRPAAMSVPEK